MQIIQPEGYGGKWMIELIPPVYGKVQLLDNEMRPYWSEEIIEGPQVLRDGSGIALTFKTQAEAQEHMERLRGEQGNWGEVGVNILRGIIARSMDADRLKSAAEEDDRSSIRKMAMERLAKLEEMGEQPTDNPPDQPLADPWLGFKIAELNSIISQSQDMIRLQDYIKNEPRASGRKIAQARLDELTEKMEEE